MCNSANLQKVEKMRRGFVVLFGASPGVASKSFGVSGSGPLKVARIRSSEFFGFLLCL
jgi:hypothetical protein